MVSVAAFALAQLLQNYRQEFQHISLYYEENGEENSKIIYNGSLRALSKCLF